MKRWLCLFLLGLAAACLDAVLRMEGENGVDSAPAAR